MAESERHLELWRRIGQALAERGLTLDGSPGEIAAAAQAALGTDAPGRFLAEYFNERQYAGGAGALSDEAAEALVRQVENLPRSIAPIPRTTATNADSGTKPAVGPRGDLEEAEAFGEEEGSRFSPTESLRRLWLDLQARRAARRAEARRLERERAEAERLRKAERVRVEAERKRLALEAETRAQRSAADRAAAEERDRKAAAERQADAELRRRRQFEQDEQDRLAARRREIGDLSARAQQQGAAGDRRGAVILLEQLVALEPADAGGWFSLGWYYSRENNYKRSTRCYERGVALEASNKIAWNNLGRDLRRLGRLEKSVAALRRSLEIDADYATAWANLGATLREKRDIAGAADAFGSAVALAPNDGPGWYWLGVCQLQLRRHDAAVTSLSRATDLLPANGDAWLRLADALAYVGRTADSRAARARARALGPPETKIGSDAVLLAGVALASSYAAFAADTPAIGLVSAASFALLAWRLRPSLAQIFFIATPALPILALPLANTAEAAPIATAALLVWVAIITRAWRRFG